jgi:hypothetical protein
MEKLVAPRKAITAHTRVVFAPADDFFTLRRNGATGSTHCRRELAAEGLSTAGFTPLQVLGVPGWWPGQDEDFYLDATVFRPKRPRKP